MIHWRAVRSRGHAKPFGSVARLLFAALSTAVFSGCGMRGPETDYGLSRGTSLNGTSAFAAICSARGHEVRPAIRLTEELAEWAEGIVRFSTYPGPPEAAEAKWYREWLAADPSRWLIYVVRDFDTQAEYWKQVRDGINQTADPDRHAEAEEKRSATVNWVAELPKKPEKIANPDDWFKVEFVANPPRVSTKLEGEWAKDVDAAAAALPVHESIHSRRGRILLSGDSKPLALDLSAQSPGNTLIIANGAFLLNEALVNVARRPLALRVADWPESRSQHVAFVEGSFVMGGAEETSTIWELMERLLSFRWVAIQMAIAGTLAALARAPRLGRPRPDPVSGADRPAAHAEALGAMLERGRATTESQKLLEYYRNWRRSPGPRQPGMPSGRSQFAAAGPRIQPVAGKPPPVSPDTPAKIPVPIKFDP
jgi:hypothetical protein